MLESYRSLCKPVNIPHQKTKIYKNLKYIHLLHELDARGGKTNKKWSHLGEAHRVVDTLG